MSQLVQCRCLVCFDSCFSNLTYHRSCVLMLATILTTGRRTITNLLRIVQHQAQGHVSSCHCVFSPAAVVDLGAGAHINDVPAGDHILPPGPVLLAGDETVTEHPGAKALGKGRQCDGVRSTHSYTAYRWGHIWVVVSVLVKLPIVTRPWTLPVLVALIPPTEWNRRVFN